LNALAVLCHFWGIRYRHGGKHASGVSDWVIHDVRRSVATGMADIGIAPHIIEAVLNHVSGHKGGVAGIGRRRWRGGVSTSPRLLRARSEKAAREKEAAGLTQQEG
jgi:hypothetical protein